MKKAPSSNSRERTRKIERTLAVFAVLTIALAWFLSRFISGANAEPFLALVFPSATRFEPLKDDLYLAWGLDETGSEISLGYVGVGEATGYGGPMKLAVGVSQEGEVVGVSVIEHKETPKFLDRVERQGFFIDFIEKGSAESFRLDEDVDAISGATITSRAITEIVRNTVHGIASAELGLPIPPEEAVRVEFGFPEVVLLALFVGGYVGHQRKFKYKNQMRWLTMITGLVVLGFIYNSPLALANINSFLIGYWPDWHTDLYWYMLIGGIVLVFTVDNKNPYCEWFCPFGAAQECMGVIGGAKLQTPRQHRSMLVWVQRGLAWLAIVLGLLLRNPGLTSYEIFGTLFDLVGSGLQFALLGLVLVASLFIRRPWCTFLCPLRPVVDFIRFIRGWIRELWLKGKQRATT